MKILKLPIDFIFMEQNTTYTDIVITYGESCFNCACLSDAVFNLKGKKSKCCKKYKKGKRCKRCPEE